MPLLSVDLTLFPVPPMYPSSLVHALLPPSLRPASPLPPPCFPPPYALLPPSLCPASPLPKPCFRHFWRAIQAPWRGTRVGRCIITAVSIWSTGGTRSGASSVYVIPYSLSSTTFHSPTLPSTPLHSPLPPFTPLHSPPLPSTPLHSPSLPSTPIHSPPPGTLARYTGGQVYHYGGFLLVNGKDKAEACVCLPSIFQAPWRATQVIFSHMPGLSSPCPCAPPRPCFPSSLPLPHPAPAPPFPHPPCQEDDLEASHQETDSKSTALCPPQHTSLSVLLELYLWSPFTAEKYVLPLPLPQRTAHRQGGAVAVGAVGSTVKGAASGLTYSINGGKGGGDGHEDRGVVMDTVEREVGMNRGKGEWGWTGGKGCGDGQGERDVGMDRGKGKWGWTGGKGSGDGQGERDVGMDRGKGKWGWTGGKGCGDGQGEREVGTDRGKGKWGWTGGKGSGDGQGEREVGMDRGKGMWGWTGGKGSGDGQGERDVGMDRGKGKWGWTGGKGCGDRQGERDVGMDRGKGKWGWTGGKGCGDGQGEREVGMDRGKGMWG
ncbi:unnamed protein product [Closterium sp. NIES-65]|nr:unnamed protein product [Closterium sp. NIES-65]